MALPWRAALCRRYSHGPSVRELYAGVESVDRLLASHRPDLFTRIAQVDELLAAGKLSPLLADHFRREVAAKIEAKSMAAARSCRRLLTPPPSPM